MDPPAPTTISIMTKIRPYLQVGLGLAVVASSAFVAYKHYSERVSIRVKDSLNETFGPYMKYTGEGFTILRIFREVYLRDASEDEFDKWTKKLDKDDGETVFRNLIHEAEPFVAQMFKKYAKRKPTPEERTRYQKEWKKVGQKEVGKRLKKLFFMTAMPDEVTVSLYGLPSNTYKMAYTNFVPKEEFVNECYIQVYARDATGLEMDYYRQSMYDLPRKIIFEYVSSSSVYYIRKLHELFNPYDPKPTSKVLEFWRTEFRRLKSNTGDDPLIYSKIYWTYQLKACPIRLFSKPFYEDVKMAANLTFAPGSAGTQKIPQEVVSRIKSIQVPFNMFNYVEFLDSKGRTLLSTKGIALRDTWSFRSPHKPPIGRKIASIKWSKINVSGKL